MIDFNKLYITPDGNNLVIDISVKSDSYYENIYIDSIKIDTEDTYTQSGPSSTPVYSYTSTENLKSMQITLSNNEILANLSDSMFFVYVTTKGTPSANTPCGMDNTTTLACIVDLYKIYQLNLQYLRELNRECCVPKNFIDLILRIKALEICMKTNNYTEAIKYWNRYFKNLSVKTSTNCGCHG